MIPSRKRNTTTENWLVDERSPCGTRKKTAKSLQLLAQLNNLGYRARQIPPAKGKLEPNSTGFCVGQRAALSVTGHWQRARTDKHCRIIRINEASYACVLELDSHTLWVPPLIYFLRFNHCPPCAVSLPPCHRRASQPHSQRLPFQTGTENRSNYQQVKLVYNQAYVWFTRISPRRC